MAVRNIKLMNAVYPDVPQVVLPVSGGGTATFTEVSDTTATAADVLSPKTFYKADGTKGTGTISTITLPTAAQSSPQSGSTKVATITPGAAKQYIDIPSGYNGTQSYYEIDKESHNLQEKTGINPSTSSQTVQADSGYDGLSSVQINAMPSGVVTAPSSINETNATKIINANTISLSKTVSVTPVVSTAGYVSSGTAGNVNVSLQAELSTKSTTSYHPSTSDQTISSGLYLTGIQTIKGVTVSGLSAENIKKDVVVKIGDSTDDDCVTSVTGTYEGGGNEFVVTVSYNSTTQMWEPDRTIAEIVAAKGAGMNISVNTDTIPSDAVADCVYDSRDHILNYCVREYDGSNLESIIEQWYQLDEDNGLTKTGEETYIIPDGSMNITQNGNNIDVTNLSSVNVNVSGGGGLEYETGTYSPTTDIAQATISFSNTHTNPPVNIILYDATGTTDVTTYSNWLFVWSDYYQVGNATISTSSSENGYAQAFYMYRGTNTTTLTTSGYTIKSQYSDTSTNSMTKYRYWVTESQFKPYTGGTSRYWQAGRTYKWIAVWKPST